MVVRDYYSLHGRHQKFFRPGSVPNAAGIVRSRFLSRHVDERTSLSKGSVLTLDVGCLYLMSMYYRRYELQKRFTFFFCSAVLTGAFSGVRLLNP